jgi:hypothetical protein
MNAIAGVTHKSRKGRNRSHDEVGFGEDTGARVGLKVEVDLVFPDAEMVRGARMLLIARLE